MNVASKKYIWPDVRFWRYEPYLLFGDNTLSPHEWISSMSSTVLINRLVRQLCYKSDSHIINGISHIILIEWIVQPCSWLWKRAFAYQYAHDVCQSKAMQKSRYSLHKWRWEMRIGASEVSCLWNIMIIELKDWRVIIYCIRQWDITILHMNVYIPSPRQ